jgi:hypothetical protein
MAEQSLLACCPGARQTTLNRLMVPYLRAVSAARENLDDEQRRAFASIGARALHKAFAAEFVVLEAEEALRRAA